MTRRLLLVRHGVTTWNREGRFQGHRDPPLHEDGRLEARLLARRLLEHETVTRLVSSPLERAAATAGLLAAALAGAGAGIAVETDRRLIEIGQGEWEGRTHAELAVDDAERYAAWRATAGADTPPGGETASEALARITPAMDELGGGGGGASDDGATICLVSHGGILRLAARHVLGLSAARGWAMDVDNASLTALERIAGGPGWRIERWNDTAHLLGRTPQHVDEAEGEPLAL